MAANAFRSTSSPSLADTAAQTPIVDAAAWASPSRQERSAVASSGTSSAAATVATGPTMADEIAFLNGLNANGTLVTSASKSYWTYEGTTARKWGAPTAETTGGTVTYYFAPASNFTSQEMTTIKQSFALWSAVADITFTAAASQSSADVLLQRGAKGSGEYFTDQGNATSGSGSTLGSYDGQTLINFDTSTAGFDLTGSFTTYGGYGLGSIVHEMGHLIGLGHGGRYNGTVNPATQQYSAYDSGLWSVMSYVIPYNNPYYKQAKYYDSYPVTGTNWGNAADGSGPVETSTTMMPLDIAAAQQLYGAQLDGPLSGGNVFGFNCNIAGPVEPFFDFTKNKQPVITLYDSGTGNTLDVSGFSQAATIDLMPGTFSSCDGLTNNIGIAFDTAIDSAVCGAGNDTITSNADVDTLTGGAGNDTYYVANSGDKIVEKGGGGTDIVHASVSFSVAGNSVETLILDGTASINGTGNGLANTIVGNAGANILTGGAGADTLTGISGADTFAYHAGWGLDTITDFAAGSAAGHDTIQIDKSLFADYATLMAHTIDSGANAIITLDATDKITIDNVAKADLTAADFKFR